MVSISNAFVFIVCHLKAKSNLSQTGRGRHEHLCDYSRGFGQYHLCPVLCSSHHRPLEVCIVGTKPHCLPLLLRVHNAHISLSPCSLAVTRGTQNGFARPFNLLTLHTHSTDRSPVYPQPKPTNLRTSSFSTQTDTSMFKSSKSKGPSISFGPTPSRPEPTAPSGGSQVPKAAGRPVPAAPSAVNWASRLGAAPKQLQIDGHWYCAVNKQNEVFIQYTSLQIAEEFNCDYVGVRAAVHNTKTTRDPMTGRDRYEPAAWHFTVEFRHRVHRRWMSAHVYTDTKTATVGPYRYVTNGLQKLERLEAEWGITKNPEVFPHVNPKVLTMKQGQYFNRKIKADGYKPKDW